MMFDFYREPQKILCPCGNEAMELGKRCKDHLITSSCAIEDLRWDEVRQHPLCLYRPCEMKINPITINAVFMYCLCAKHIKANKEYSIERIESLLKNIDNHERIEREKDRDKASKINKILKKHSNFFSGMPKSLLTDENIAAWSDNIHVDD